ncbi:MAG: DUF6134 family protein [Kiloniellaceae bacterium]
MDFAVPPACRRLRALLFIAPLLAAAAGLCLAAPAAAEEPMVFDVLRDGSKIGEHRLVFERDDSTLKVSVETDMSVRFAFVTVFRYEHKRVERWRDGELESLAGITNDDGTQYEISIVRKEGHYSRTVNGAEEELTGPVAVDSLWSKDRLAAGKLFSAASDKVYRVRSDLLGMETIEAKGGAVEAEHYKLSGEIERDLWYDPGGELLRIKYESDAGETFEFVRR